MKKEIREHEILQYKQYIGEFINLNLRLGSFSECLTKDPRLRNWPSEVFTKTEKIKSYIRLVFVIFQALSGAVRSLFRPLPESVQVAAENILICLDEWSPWDGVGGKVDHIWGDAQYELNATSVVLSESHKPSELRVIHRYIWININNCISFQDWCYFLKSIVCDLKRLDWNRFFPYIFYVRDMLFNYKCYVTLRNCFLDKNLFFHGEFHAHGRSVASAAIVRGVRRNYTIAVAHAFYFDNFLQYHFNNTEINFFPFPDVLVLQGEYTESLMKRNSQSLPEDMIVLIGGSIRMSTLLKHTSKIAARGSSLGILLSSGDRCSLTSLLSVDQLPRNCIVRGHPTPKGRRLIQGADGEWPLFDGDLASFFCTCDRIIVGSSHGIADALRLGKRVARIQELSVPKFRAIEEFPTITVAEFVTGRYKFESIDNLDLEFYIREFDAAKVLAAVKGLRENRGC